MRNDAVSTIEMYVDNIRALYQNKDEVILWARNHQDKANTAAPLAEVEELVKRVVAVARRQLDINSLHLVDKVVHEMELVLEVLERAYKLEKEQEAGWGQEKFNFSQEAI